MPDPCPDPGTAGIPVPTRPHRAASPRRPDPVRLARVALAWLARTGDTRILQLAQDYGPQLALQRLMTGQEPDINLRPLSQAWGPRADLQSVARTVLQRTKQLRARVITPEDDDWPPQLDDLGKLSGDASRYRPPPVCLWARGKASLRQLLARSVAIVGARKAASFGAYLAGELSYQLAQEGWTVVSGGTYGVDAAAHRGALTAAGPTVAFLGCGIDCTYPVSHHGLFDRIPRKGGLLVSQWPPRSAPVRYRFAQRCGPIAASTRAVVMVEGCLHGQALKTLSYARALGRPVLVLPGPPTSVRPAGCHQLLRRHPDARLVTNAADIVTEVERGGGRDHH